MDSLIIAVVAGLFALTGGLLGSWLGRKNEHKQWLRNRKLDAYMEVLETARPLDTASHVDRTREVTDNLLHVLLKVQVFGSEKVRKAAGTYYFHSDALQEYGQSILSPEPITQDESQHMHELARRMTKSIYPLITAIRNDLEASTGAEVEV